jgi:hypothetical protein
MSEIIEPDGVLASNVSVLRMCRCNRAPHRPGQRNCHFCNAEAAKKYRRSVKKLIEIARNVKLVIGGGA